MDEDKYLQFIDLIIQKTKSSELQWKYLDSNRDLYEGMHWTEEHEEPWSLLGPRCVTSPNFDQEDSFFATMNNMYIVLLTHGSHPADMYVVPTTYKKTVHLTSEVYGEQITRLHNLVQSKFPDANNFIDSIISGKSDNM